MLISDSTASISHYMGKKSRYAIKQSSSFRMASSVLRRQALWDICKDNARQTEAIHSEWKNYSFLKRHHGAKSQQECVTLASFLSLKWLDSSLTCKYLHNNSVSVIHMIELATSESNTHMCYSTVSQSSQIDSKTPALASHQAAPQLTMHLKKCSCCEMDG